MEHIMKKLLTGVAFAISLIGASAQAAGLDLTTFTVSGSGSTSPTFASISGTSTLSGTVSGVSSFDWFFQAGDYMPYDDYSYFISTATGTVNLSSVGVVGDYGNSGWQTYNFASAYTGALIFGVSNALDDVGQSTLSIQNVSAVPEPETFALMLAGFGLVGTIVRRRKQALAV
jgi:hypothetical protein